MIESRLLVAKPFAFFYHFIKVGRDCSILIGRGKLPLLRQLRFLVLLLAKLLLCLLLSRLLARS